MDRHCTLEKDGNAHFDKGRYRVSGPQIRRTPTDRSTPTHPVSNRFDALHYANASEECLLSASRSGDSYAFGELCQRHSHTLRGQILRIVRHHEDAEDVFQETLLNAFRHLDSFRGTCKFQTWIVRIGINCSLILLRKRKSRSWLSAEVSLGDSPWCDGSAVPDTSPTPEQVCVKEQVRQLAAHSVAQLRKDLRCLVERHYGDGCSVSDIALDLGISIPAAKARIHRARRLLRAHVERRLSHSCGR